MIYVRPLNPVDIVGDRDPVIASFADSTWRDLIELAGQFGFRPPDVQSYYSPPYDRPVNLGAETSQELWEAISAVYKDVYKDGHAIPHAVSERHVRKLQVKHLMECAQIGAEHSGIEIRRGRDED